MDISPLRTRGTTNLPPVSEQQQEEEEDITGAFLGSDTGYYGGGGISDPGMEEARRPLSSHPTFRRGSSGNGGERRGGGMNESTSLVSSMHDEPDRAESDIEIEGFANNSCYHHNAISSPSDSRAETGLGLSASVMVSPLLSPSSSSSKDVGASSACRSSRRARAAEEEEEEASWSPQHLRATTSYEPFRGGQEELVNLRGGSGSRHSSSDSQSDAHSTSSQHGSQITLPDTQTNPGDASPEIEIPPKSPLRKSLMGTGYGNYSVGGGGGEGSVRNDNNRGEVLTLLQQQQNSSSSSSIWDDGRPRYQLVDEILERDDVPILSSPRRVRNQRNGKRESLKRGRGGERESRDWNEK